MEGRLKGTNLYACAVCRAHTADHDDILSKAFHGRHGRAMLFNDVINIRLGSPEERMLMTGRHVVVDIACNSCGSVLGWKYEKAYEPSQKYKEGKYILEKAKIVREGGW